MTSRLVILRTILAWEQQRFQSCRVTWAGDMCRGPAMSQLSFHVTNKHKWSEFYPGNGTVNAWQWGYSCELQTKSWAWKIIFATCSHCLVNYIPHKTWCYMVVGGGTHGSACIATLNRYSYTHTIVEATALKQDYPLVEFPLMPGLRMKTPPCCNSPSIISTQIRSWSPSETM